MKIVKTLLSVAYQGLKRVQVSVMMRIIGHIFFVLLISLSFWSCSSDVLTFNEDASEGASQDESVESETEQGESQDDDSERDSGADSGETTDDDTINEDVGPEVESVTVAFIGDQGLDEDSEAVLELILSEGTDMVLHQGDFDYEDNPDGWDAQINNILGENYPYFASVGNHDYDDDEEENMWDEYQEKLQERLDRIEGAICEGDLGAMSSCTYKGLFSFSLVWEP